MRPYTTRAMLIHGCCGFIETEFEFESEFETKEKQIGLSNK